MEARVTIKVVDKHDALRDLREIEHAAARAAVQVERLVSAERKAWSWNAPASEILASVATEAASVGVGKFFTAELKTSLPLGWWLVEVLCPDQSFEENRRYIFDERPTIERVANGSRVRIITDTRWVELPATGIHTGSAVDVKVSRLTAAAIEEMIR